MNNKKTLFLISALCSTLYITGCTPLVGPDFVRPEAPESTGWTTEAAEVPKAESATDFNAWWKGFGDPLLNKLIEKSYQQNLDLRQAGLRILEARASLGIAVGQQLPQAQQVNGSVTNANSSKNSANPLGNNYFSDYDLGFDAAWELDFWGRFRRGVESAQASLNATVTDYDNALVSLTAEVARAYVSMRTFDERIQLALENVKIQERSLQIADVRFRNGIVTELDVQQAKTLLNSTKASVPFLKTGLRQTENSLAILLGVPPSQLREIIGDNGSQGVIPAPPSKVEVGIPADLIRRRPDVRNAELLAASQSAQIGIARADLFPSISIIGSIGYNSKNTNDLFESDSFTGSIGPGVNWNILNYGRIKNNVRVQDARLEQLLVNYENVVLKAYQEVEDSLSGYVRTGEQVGFLKQSVAASERSLKLSMLQYADGVIDYNRVLTVQDALVLQQDKWVEARGNQVLFLVSLYKSMGGGWQIRQGQDFVPAATIEKMRNRTDWGDILPQKDVPETPELPKTGKEQPLFNKVDW